MKEKTIDARRVALPRPPTAKPARVSPMPIGKPVGAAVSTMQLLRFAVEHAKPWTATEASRALGLNPSTCFNLVQTLVGEGVLEAAADSKRYVVGHGLIALANVLIGQSRDLSAVRPAMQAVADRFRVTVTIWKRRSLTRMELVLSATCNTAVNIHMPVGQRMPVLVGGMGRIMALDGGLTVEQRQEAFDEIRWDRPLSMATLMAQARQARKVGWGIDDGYMSRSVTAIAVPVRMASAGEPVEYVCSVTMFRHQYSPAVYADIVGELQVVAGKVGGVLGSRGVGG